MFFKFFRSPCHVADVRLILSETREKTDIFDRRVGTVGHNCVVVID